MSENNRCLSWCWIDDAKEFIKTCQKARSHVEKDHSWLSAVADDNTRVLAIWEKDAEVANRYIITIEKVANV